MTKTKTVNKKKSTYFISEDLLAEIKEIVPATGLRSQNAVVEEALRAYIEDFKHDEIRRRYLKASKDPKFLADMSETETAFKTADAETARMIQ